MKSKALINKNKFERVSLYGHGMGGILAMRYSLQYPNDIEKLIVVDAVPSTDNNFIAEKKDLKTYFQTLLQVNLSETQSKTQASSILEPHIPDAILRAYLVSALKCINTKDSKSQWKWNINLESIMENLDALHDFDYYGNVSRDQVFNKPTLFIYGENYWNTISSSIRHDLVKRFPEVKISQFLEAKRWIQFTHTTHIFETLNQFFNTYPISRQEILFR